MEAFVLNVGYEDDMDLYVLISNKKSADIKKAYRASVDKLGFKLDYDESCETLGATSDIITEPMYSQLLELGFPFNEYGIKDKKLTRDTFPYLYAWFVCQSDPELELTVLGFNKNILNNDNFSNYIFGYAFTNAYKSDQGRTGPFDSTGEDDISTDDVLESFEPLLS